MIRSDHVHPNVCVCIFTLLSAYILTVTNVNQEVPVMFINPYQRNFLFQHFFLVANFLKPINSILHQSASAKWFLTFYCRTWIKQIPKLPTYICTLVGLSQKLVRQSFLPDKFWFYQNSPAKDWNGNTIKYTTWSARHYNRRLRVTTIIILFSGSFP